jgi:hypothetical protein
MIGSKIIAGRLQKNNGRISPVLQMAKPDKRIIPL